MTRALVVSLPIAALGLLLTAIPLRLLPVCAVQHGASPMKCHWSGQMLAGFGVTFFLLALLLFACRTAGVRMGISAAAVLFAVMAGMVPAYLIGMCGAPTMPCRTGTYPAVMIVLSLIAAAGFFNILYLRHTNIRESRGHETSDNLAPSR